MPDRHVASDSRYPGRGDDVVETLGAAVLAVPGVLRLEPTLETAGPRILLSARTGDGIHLLLRAGLAEVDVDLAVRAGRPARETAAQVRHVIEVALLGFGLAPGVVTVNVLAIGDDELPAVGGDPTV